LTKTKPVEISNIELEVLCNRYSDLRQHLADTWRIYKNEKGNYLVSDCNFQDEYEIPLVLFLSIVRRNDGC